MTPRSVQSPAIRIRQFGLVLTVLLLAIWMAHAFLIPLAWAAVLAIAEWPLYRRAIARFPNHNLLVAIGFAFATALIILGPLSLAAVSLAQESQTGLDWLEHVQKSGITPPSWLAGIPLVGSRAANYWQQHLGSPQAASGLLGSLSAASVLTWTKSIGGEIARQLGLFLITLIALVSLLLRGKQIRHHGGAVAVRLFGTFGGQFVDHMVDAVRGTVNGTAIVSFGEGAIIGVGYLLASVPQPLLFTTFTILLALVPFGAWLAFGLASLILIAGGHLLAGGLLFGFGAIVMTLGDNVVQPAVIGSSVELPFLLALIGAFGGLAEIGLVGLFIGPVIMAALLLAWHQWIKPTVYGHPTETA
ncbi:MAG: AI-2E family transporter [Sphingomicrobium sp.]